MTVIYSEIAKKQLKKLDKTTQTNIVRYMAGVAKLEDPRMKGKPLVGNLAKLWRYRIGDYRAICDIQDEKILITVLKIGHRREVYFTG